MSAPETTGSDAAGLDAAGTQQAGPGRRQRIGGLLRTRPVEASSTFFVFIALFVVYGVWLGDRFLNVDARLLDIHQNVPLFLLGLAAMVTLIAGVFDLSIAAMASLTAFLVIGLPVNQGVPFALAVVICLLIGVAGGLLNGFLVELLRVNPFIVTLGTGGIFVGISIVYGDGGYVIPGEGTASLPTWFTSLGNFGHKTPWWLLTIVSVAIALTVISALASLKPSGWSSRRWLACRIGIVGALALILVFALDFPSKIAETSWLVAVLIAAGMAMWVLMQYTTSGRYLKATGANREAARLAGVNVRREVIRAFVISGLLAALAGIMLGAIQGSAAPQVGTSFLLPAFAAAFVSTVVFSTGHFTVWGTIVGGIFIVWVNQGLIIGGLPVTWTDVVNGAVLITVVALSRIMRRGTG